MQKYYHFGGNTLFSGAKKKCLTFIFKHIGLIAQIVFRICYQESRHKYPYIHTYIYIYILDITDNNEKQ